MGESKHTPGPWTYHAPDEGHPSEVAVGAVGGGVLIYRAHLSRETEANARLIAAAPQMLEAHEQTPDDVASILACVEAIGAGSPDRLALLQRISERALVIRQRSTLAIKAATGGET